MIHNNNIGCVIFWNDDRYEKMVKNAINSFKYFHPDIELVAVDKIELRNLFCSQYGHIPAGIMKFMVACEIMHTKKWKKTIILGADTITCDYLSEFIENDEDILATLDYDYPLIDGELIAEKGKHLNADVVCFNNIEALKYCISASHKYKTYFEQAALNEAVWKSGKFSHNLVELDESASIQKFYNVRVKGYVVAKPGESPWEPYISKFLVKDGKLYNKDNLPIKVWHYCQGFGTLPPSLVEIYMKEWSEKHFNKETVEFFRSISCKEYF